MSNVSRGNQVVVDRAAELAIYDALPTKWRRLVDSLPIPQAMTTIAEYRSKLGNEQGYARIVEVFSSKFPGWTPPSKNPPIVIARLCREGVTTRRRARGIIAVPTYGDAP